MPFNDLTYKYMELSPYERDFILSPKQWVTYSLPDSFNWEIHPFQPDQVEKIPSKPGIYSFVIQPGIAAHPHCSYLMYVGKTERTLRERFREYFDEEKDVETGRPKLVIMFDLYQGYVHFCCAVVMDTNRIKKIEEALLKAFIPPCNDQYPAEIRRSMKAFQ